MEVQGDAQGTGQPCDSSDNSFAADALLQKAQKFMDLDTSEDIQLKIQRWIARSLRLPFPRLEMP